MTLDQTCTESLKGAFEKAPDGLAACMTANAKSFIYNFSIPGHTKSFRMEQKRRRIRRQTILMTI